MDLFVSSVVVFTQNIVMAIEGSFRTLEILQRRSYIKNKDFSFVLMRTPIFVGLRIKSVKAC